MRELMSIQAVLDCAMRELPVEGNEKIFRQILSLPYPVFVEALNRLCSGEMTLEDFDVRLLRAELASSHLGAISDVDIDEEAVNNVGVESMGDQASLLAASAVSRMEGGAPVVWHPPDVSLVRERIAQHIANKYGAVGPGEVVRLSGRRLVPSAGDKTKQLQRRAQSAKIKERRSGIGPNAVEASALTSSLEEASHRQRRREEKS